MLCRYRTSEKAAYEAKAKAWEDDYAENLRAFGYARGQAAATVFREPVGNVSLAVHGDDFTALGPIEELNELEVKMKEWYEVKTRGRLEPEKNDGEEIKILRESDILAVISAPASKPAKGKK